MKSLAPCIDFDDLAAVPARELIERQIPAQYAESYTFCYAQAQKLAFGIAATAQIASTAQIGRGCQIAPDARIGPDAYLAPGVIVGAGCVLEAGVIVGARTYLGDKVRLGARTRLGPENYLGPEVVLGEDCFAARRNNLLHNITTGNRIKIGGDNFLDGFVRLEDEVRLMDNNYLSVWAKLAARVTLRTRCVLLPHAKVRPQSELDECYLGTDAVVEPNCQLRGVTVPAGGKIPRDTRRALEVPEI